jgi:septum formation protein
LKHLILASRSPRRRELLKLARLPFEVSVSTIEEKMEQGIEPGQLVESLAQMKAIDVARDHDDSVVLGADTVVVFRDRILGKPNSADNAREMLALLSGKTHQVYTGVTIIHNKTVRTFHESTNVTFWDLSAEEIDAYIQSGESFDKAGGYGIQGLGSLLVKEIYGDYFNVVGLPISRIVRELKRFGVNPITVSHGD